jgi:hypothetical protein
MLTQADVVAREAAMTRGKRRVTRRRVCVRSPFGLLETSLDST